jgi:orotate phosphoribosyltransferase
VNRTELAIRIAERCWLSGTFQLRSGQTSASYFDKYRFEADPVLLAAVSEHLVPLIPPGTEVLAGIEMGAIPIVTALSLQTGLPACFVRKAAKGYGTAKFAEGADVAGKSVLLIEDVVTTGGQIIESARMLREAGATISRVLCVLLRDPVAVEKLDAVGLDLSSLFQAGDLPAKPR